MRVLVCGLIVLAGLSVDADAQTGESRATASLLVGAGRTWDDEGGLGNGPVVGGRVDWRIFGATSVEVSVDALSHDRRGGFFEAEGRTVFLGASLVHRFGSAVVQPYVLGGAHLARHSGSTTFGGRRTERESTDVGYHAGGGVAVRVGNRIEVGPEARLYMIRIQDDSDPAMAYWIGVRVGIRF